MDWIYHVPRCKTASLVLSVQPVTMLPFQATDDALPGDMGVALKRQAFENVALKSFPLARPTWRGTRKQFGSLITEL